MIVLPDYGACFVAVPKAGSQAVSRWLERNARKSRTFAAEGLHDWHATIAEVEATGELPFSLHDAWTFAVVRNPFDRLVSFCAKHDEGFAADPQGTLRRRLERDDERLLWPQVFFTAGVKTVYRFEALQEACEAIRGRLGFEEAEPLERVNASERGRYQSYYDAELKALAESVYADDLRAFGYGF